MAKHKLNANEQLKGVRAALRSPRTPPQLRNGLQRRAAELERLIKNAAHDTQSESTHTSFPTQPGSTGPQRLPDKAESSEDNLKPQGQNPPLSQEDEKRFVGPLTLLELKSQQESSRGAIRQATGKAAEVLGPTTSKGGKKRTLPLTLLELA